jgi:hypothetical protein
MSFFPLLLIHFYFPNIENFLRKLIDNGCQLDLTVIFEDDPFVVSEKWRAGLSSSVDYCAHYLVQMNE